MNEEQARELARQNKILQDNQIKNAAERERARAAFDAEKRRMADEQQRRDAQTKQNQPKKRGWFS